MLTQTHAKGTDNHHRKYQHEIPKLIMAAEELVKDAFSLQRQKP